MRGQPAPGVYVVSGRIQTGKTTRLRAWCADRLSHPLADGARPAIDGILAPVVNGHRHLLHVPTGVLRDLEDLSGGASAVNVRRFTFNADVFAWARSCLLGAARPTPQSQALPAWIIVDEIGPLELSGGGLEPAVSGLLSLAGFGADGKPRVRHSGHKPDRSERGRTRVVLVIRENLVDDVLKHFGLSPSHIHPFPFV
jgi:hypothetical protein